MEVGDRVKYVPQIDVDPRLRDTKMTILALWVDLSNVERANLRGIDGSVILEIATTDLIDWVPTRRPTKSTQSSEKS